MVNRITSPRQLANRRSGFSLVEMLIVLVITGMVMALALPKLDVNKYRADSVAMLVRTSLQYAQRVALVKQHDVSVSFDTAGGRMRVFWDADNNQVVAPAEHIIWRALEVGNRFGAPSTTIAGTAGTTAIAGTKIKVVDGMPSFTFHRDGTASTDVEIYIAVAGKGTAKVARAITLIQSTGRAEWYRLDPASGKWRPAAL